MACSIPPVYRSTGLHAARRSGSNGNWVLCESRYLNQYQDESMKVSSVSVSRRAGPPQVGQVVLTKLAWLMSGLWPDGVNSASSGNRTGSSSYGTGTTPQASQY